MGHSLRTLLTNFSPGEIPVHFAPGTWLKTEITWKPSVCKGYREIQLETELSRPGATKGEHQKRRKTAESGAAFSEAYLSFFGWEIKTSNLKIKGLLMTKPVHIGFSWKYHRSSAFLTTKLLLSYRTQLHEKITHKTLQRSSNVSQEILSIGARLPHAIGQTWKRSWMPSPDPKMWGHLK